MQTGFKSHGLILLVKPRDKNKYKEERSKAEKDAMVKKSQKNIAVTGYQINTYTDLNIPLEKMLQVFLSLVISGQFAFTKKAEIFKQGKDIFDHYSSKITSYLTIGDMIHLYFLYKRAERDQKSSDYKKKPYHIISSGLLVNLS